MRILKFLLGVCSSSILLLQVTLASSVNGAGSMIVRVRLGDGSMEKLSIPKGAEDTMTLKQVLSSVEGEETTKSNTSKAKGSSLRVGTKNVKDTSQTLSSLGIKHGSLITVVPPPVDKEQLKKEKEEQLLTMKDDDRFDPFPDLAKDYKSALLKTKARRSGSGGMSYGDIARMQSSFHVVEPQPEGPIKRVYMCASSAERFQSNCLVIKKPNKKGEKATTSVQNRAALLFGTMNRERVDTKPVKVRTSLSSSPSDRDYCNVIKVHALYEPPQTPTSTYDCKELMKWSDKSPTMKRVLNLASQLGLEPVGWIFTYDQPRHDEKKSGDDNGALPVWGPDVKTGASLQISKMKNAKDRIEGKKFVTLAMDATSGATEAFQLSDVSVQMVAENILGDEIDRHVSTKIPIIVDSKQTKKLDSVLCLVNTAMLTHEGMYAGIKKVNPLKKNGTLTIKTKKKLLGALNKYDPTKTSNNLFEILSDFNVLVGLDSMIPPTDMSEICRLVKKWARGQRRGTFMDEKRILLLKSVLGG